MNHAAAQHSVFSSPTPGSVSIPDSIRHIPGPHIADAACDALLSHLRRTVWQKDDAQSVLEPCLCALILALAPNIDASEVVEALTPHTGALTLPAFLNSMVNLGHQSKSGYFRPADIDRRLLPCLFMPALSGSTVPNQAYVILSVSSSDNTTSMTVFNGKLGRTQQVSAGDPLVSAMGKAHFFLPAKREDEITSATMRAQSGNSWFGATLRRFKGTIYQLAAVGVTLSFVGLGTPLFIMLVYDRVIAPRTSEPLRDLVIGVMLAITMEWVLRSLRSHALSWLAARLDYVVGTEIFERLIQLPPAFVERASVAAQIARIKTFESVRDFFSGPVVMSLVELPTIIVSIAAIAYFGGILALVPLVVAVFYLFIFFLVRQKVVLAIRQAAKATSVTQQFAIETFEKHEAIRGSGLLEIWAGKYADLSGRENLLQFRLFFLGNIGETFAHALTLVAALGTLAIGTHLIWAGEITTGILVASMILTWRVLTPFHSLCTMIPRFEQLRNAVLQINKLMDLPTEDEATDVSARLSQIKGRVTFSNTSLRYSREAGLVFLGLNADIQPGNIVAISGSNGSGKSSILKLVQGLYPPVTGTVRIDGFDIRQLVQRDLRKLIGYVPQSPVLLPGTLADNLSIAKPLASEEELWQALEDVGAAEDVAALPGGLATNVGLDGDDNINSVLKYRLSFARALLLDSQLLLIDEQPNAVLHAGIADVLKQILQKSRGKRTVLFVSHRADFLRMADRVIALRYGQVPVFEPLDRVLELVS